MSFFLSFFSTFFPPSNYQSSINSIQNEIKRYRKQFQAAQNLRQKKLFLKQKTEHYKMMEDLLSRKLKS